MQCIVVFRKCNIGWNRPRIIFCIHNNEHLICNRFIWYFELGTCSKNECYYNITIFLVAILVAILNFVMMVSLNELNIIKIGFLDPPKLQLDTKIMVLAALERDLGVFLQYICLIGSHFGGHLEFCPDSTHQLNIIKIDFFDPKSLSFDTNIIVRSALEPDLWLFQFNGGHLEYFTL